MNIYVLNTLAIGYDSIEYLNRHLDLQGVIGLSEREASDSISDYVFQESFCQEQDLNFVSVDTYTLSRDTDREKLLALDIDLLVVGGWQRLVPDWLIKHTRLGVIGSHGSPFGITKGRGRSPQNWTLMLGLKKFFISIFKIDPGIDSGDIIDTREFELGPFDDIQTSYYKVMLLTSHMIVENVRNGKIEQQTFQPQEEEGAEYFPQRTPEDGLLDWNRSSESIYDFVRALTRPYPGAITKMGETSIRIWRAIPFSVPHSEDYQPGEVVKVFNKGDVLVKTADQFLLIREYSADETDFAFKAGQQLESVQFPAQMKRIAERHQGKYPDLPIANVILQAGEVE